MYKHLCTFNDATDQHSITERSVVELDIFTLMFYTNITNSYLTQFYFAAACYHDSSGVLQDKYSFNSS